MMTDCHVGYGGRMATTSSGLLEKARRQDPEAWERMVTLYGPLLYYWCRKWGLQAQDAGNVSQETFLVVASKLHEYRHDRTTDTFRGWLYRIAQHKFYDVTRRCRPGGIGVGGDDAQTYLQSLAGPSSDDQSEQALAEETSMLYRRAVELIRGEFSELDWQAFYRVVVEGQRPRDVAQDLVSSINSVYLAKSRILRRAREEFADLLEDSGF